MEFRGVFENGVVKPDGPVDLPEGTVVEFQAAGNGEAGGAPRRQTSAEELRRMTREFWANRSLEQIAEEQGIKPVISIDDFPVLDVTDEDLEALERMIRERRDSVK